MKADLIDRWEADALTRGLDPKTIKAYGWSLKSIQETLGRPLSKMDKMDIRSYIDICRKENLTTRTIRSRLNALSSFYDFLMHDSKESEKTIPFERSVPATFRSIKPPVSSILTR
jgi:site-specific recombinase XerD